MGTSSLVNGAVWDGYGTSGDVALLEELHHWGKALSDYSLTPTSSSLCFLCVDKT